MMTRELNWFGWSIETIAAVYETDAAACEWAAGEVSEEYLWAAWEAERLEGESDRQ